MNSGPLRFAFERRASAALPVLAVLVVGIAMLSRKPRPVIGFRLRGGPTAGAHVLSWRLEVVESSEGVERPSLAAHPVNATATTSDGRLASFSGRLDAEGAGALRFQFPDPPVTGPVRIQAEIPVSIEKATIAARCDERVELSRTSWAAAARRRGGWVVRSSTSGFVLRVAAERGVFAVPFQDGLWLEAHHPDLAPSAIAVTSEGASVTYDRPIPTNPGRTRFWVVPDEYAASATFRAHLPDAPEAQIAVGLAVLPGALHATLVGGGVVVESPILRERAYVAIVTESERVDGGTVELRPDGKGGARGVFAPAALPESGPLWAVVSSEPELRSESTVGWPIRYRTDGEPPTTFDVSDALLFDTLPIAIRREALRLRRMRVSAAAVASSALLLTALIVGWSARRAASTLKAHLKSAGSDPETTIKMARPGDASRWYIAAAILCLTLGASLVGFFAAWM